MNAAGRRRWGLALGWLVTTALAVGLALAAVGAVSDSVTENRPKPLSAAAVSAALADGTGPDAEAPTATTESSGTAPTSATTPPPPTTRGTSPSPTTKPPAPNPTTASTAPVPSTTQTSIPGGERSYEMVGGSVRVRFADGRAELLSATPNAGFRVSRNSGDPGDVRVNFRSADHESRFRAWWDNGPREEIEEKRR